MSVSNVKAGRAFIELAAEGGKNIDRELAKIENRMKAFSRNMSATGASLATMGATLFVPLAAAGKVFADFDDQMRAVKAVSQSTEAEFQRMTATAKQLGATTSYTAVQVAGIMAELGRAGFVATQIEAMTGAVLDLARATGTDAVISSGIMASTIRQFGLEAKDSTRVADGLTAAANKSFNSVESLGEALKYVGPDAAAANMSLEETLALLGALGNVGKQGSEAGTAMRRLITMSGAEAKMWSETFGIEALDAVGNVRPLIDILDDVTKSVEGMASGERLEKFNKAFGLLGITAATALGKSAGSARELRTAIEGATGVAAETAKEMDAGLGGDIRKTLSALEGAVIALGEAVAPLLSKVAAAISAAAEWARENKVLLGGLMELGIKVGVTLVAVGAAALVIGKLAGAAAMAVGAVRLLGTALTFFAANPAAIVAVAIAGALALLAREAMKASTYTAKLRNETEAMIEKGQKLRQADAQRMARLQELGRAEKLNSEQMKEAASLISILQERYGELGLSIDQTTGKIGGLTDAQQKLSEAMRQTALVEARLAVQEAQHNYSERSRARKADNESFPIWDALLTWDNRDALLAGFEAGGGTVKGGRVEGQESDAMRAERLAGQQLKAAQAKLRAIEQGDAAAILGEVPTPKPTSGTRPPGPDSKTAEALKKAREEARRADEKLLDMDRQRADRKRTEHERELARIRSEFNERRRLIDLQINAERKRLQGTGRTSSALLDVLQAERKAQDELQHKDTAAAEQADLDKRRQSLMDHHGEVDRMERSQAEATARARIDSADTPEERKRAEDALHALRKQHAEEEAGEWLDEQVKRVRELYAGDPAGMAEMTARLQALADQMAVVPKAVEQADARSSVTGTFSAIAAGLMGGGGGYAERTAKATEKSNGLLDRLVKSIERQTGAKFA